MKLYNEGIGIASKPNMVPKFTVGQTIRIERDSERKGMKFQGRVIAVTNHFITIKNKLGIKESFTFNDFRCGYVKLAALKIKN
jgi:hypothetical protein